MQNDEKATIMEDVEKEKFFPSFPSDKTKSNQREIVKKLRFFQSEWDEIQHKLGYANFGVWARCTLLEKEIPKGRKDFSVEQKKAIADLNGLSNNVNQLAKYINANKHRLDEDDEFFIKITSAVVVSIMKIDEEISEIRKGVLK